MPKGGVRPGAGRKSKAEEFGLNELFRSAWPYAERVKAIQHLAILATTAEKEAVRVSAAQLLLSYAYGKPATMPASDLAPPDDLDLSADVASMTEEERAIYRLRLEQYLARVRASGKD